MTLQKRKHQRQKTPSTYSKDHPIFKQIHQKYCAGESESNSASTAKAMANKAESNIGEDCAGNIPESKKQFADRDSIKKHRDNYLNTICANKPNYFITLSMKPCFNRDWSNYDREYHVIKLYKSASVLIYKLLTKLDRSLKKISYRYWPYFFGTMEHFDKEGNLVAPHLHILLRHPADLQTIAEIVKALWAQAVPEAGETGVDVQVIEPKQLWKRASYILKDSHQDGLEVLQNGVKPHDVCKKYQWSLDAIAHEKWRLNRETLHKARTTKQPILKANNPTRRMNSALKKVFGNLSEAELSNGLPPEKWSSLK